ncbi:MAG: DNA mismatch repair protein MutS [Promethearchaeota archaeon]
MTLEELNLRDLTPMMQHWYSVKQKYKKRFPEAIVAYRMGDFFEFFYEDAIKVSNLLGITLTRRKVGNDSYPLAGIPHHAGSYLKNLVSQGQTVIIVDQLEDPATVKGRIVKRGVVRILSPGTIIESDILNSSENNYICSIVKDKDNYGIAFADISTGEFKTIEFLSKEKDAFERLLSIYSQHDPVEVIIPNWLKSDEKLFVLIKDLNNALIKPYDDHVFEHDNARSLILQHFQISNLESFGIEDKILAIRASGGLLAFLKETQRDIIPNIFKISLIQEKGILLLDYITQRNLELIRSLWERGKEVSLYSIFNKTRTPMGARLLKKIMLQPLTDIREINRRLNIVQKLKEDVFLRSDLREELKVIGDLERYINRLNFSNSANARDLINIKNSLDKIPKIKKILEKAQITDIQDYLQGIKSFIDLSSLIEASIVDDPPSTVREGNIIKFGFNKKVDELRDILQNGKKYILEYEEEQKKRWRLTSGLKVGHNNILGYYIQITLNALKSIPNIPNDYIERQTLKNAKRFTTQKLKELEEKIVQAEEKINELEYQIFCEIREQIIKKTEKILETAKNIAYIDVFACFAEIAETYDYCRPIVNEEDKIIIKDGRHPVIERVNLSEPFIPNDCYLDTEKEQILIITGPNMAGKSTYLRQVALICIIAQMGSYVPASSAMIGIIDKIFTRIGASDDLARKLSTFMIEMTETAKILNYTTPKSLVIIDELGRGTSTSDGQSIAMATLEKLHELRCKTLFSTHYHQLTEINLPRIKNYHLDIIENDDGTINFVRKLKPGSTDKSYGIHVAKLAGLPDDVIIRAFEILDQIEKEDPFRNTVRNNGNNFKPGKYHDKLIREKIQELNKLNEQLKKKKSELVECESLLDEKKKELGMKTYELEKVKEEIKKIQSKSNIKMKEDKKRKLVQTTFFMPKVIKEPEINENVKEIIKILEELDLNALTPIDAMKEMIKLKELLNQHK